MSAYYRWNGLDIAKMSMEVVSGKFNTQIAALYI